MDAIAAADESEVSEGIESNETFYTALDLSPRDIEDDVDPFLPTIDPGLIKFSLGELEAYTDVFREDNRVGRGVFGSVFKGIISGREDDCNGKPIAVKVSWGIRQDRQWENEVTYLPRVNHENIIQLIGFGCTSKRFFLVFPLMELGSVKSSLDVLDWTRTLKIITGTTLALRELQQHEPPLIFRDLKPDNILLDRDFNPKLADFGLVTLQGQISNGHTMGYMLYDEVLDPGHVKLDIYSLGVTILQLIMKRKDVVRANDPDQIRYPEGSLIRDWAEEEYSKSKNIVHSDLDCNRTVAKAISKLGLRCVKTNKDERPSVSEVLEALSKLDKETSLTKKFGKKLTISCMKK